MPRKRKPVKPPKGERLIPIPSDRRRWYQTAVTTTVNGLAKLFGIFRRRKKAISPRAAHKRRKN